jgi:PAS domain S-box-containing protein
MSEDASEADKERQAPRGLADFLREEREHILAAWEEAARAQPAARGLDSRALRDHLPHLLRQLEQGARSAGGSDAHLPTGGYPELHALERLGEGYDLEQVVDEYALLRETVLRLWVERGFGSTGGLLLNRALDEAIRASVSRFHQTRQRTLVALDRLSAAALGSRDIAGVLHALARVLLETTEAVDSVILYLREGERLTAHVTAGLEGAEGFALAVGEGFSGRIASERRPLQVRDAADSQEVRNPALREAGVRALYGVPMLHGEEVVGVAQVGSRTAYDFSSDDKLLFRAMVERATSALVQHQLREALEAERRRLTAEHERLLEVEAERARLLEAESRARQEAEGALALLHSFMDSSPVGFAFLGKDLRFVMANRVFAEMAGRRPEEYPGRPVQELVPREVIERNVAVYRSVLLEGEPVLNREVPVEWPAGSGQTRYRLGSYFPVRPAGGGAPLGLGLVVQDVTERKRLEAALAAREEQFRTLAEAMPQMVWTAAPDGALDYVNRRTLDFAGAREEEVLGRGWAELLHPDRRAQVEAAWAQARARGTPYEAELHLKGAGGAYRWFLARAEPVRGPDGAVLRWLGTSTDVDDFKRAQEELERRSEFEEKLVGIVSHDLRNPLQAVSVTARHLLSRADLQAPLLPGLQRISRSAERMGRMISDVLDFTRARQGGGIPIARRPGSLAEVAHAVVDELEVTHPGRVRLECSAGAGRGSWDADRLAQALGNLVANALVHGEPGQPVTVSLHDEGPDALLSVHNLGPPIPPALLGAIFDPFRRAAAHGAGGAGGHSGAGGGAGGGQGLGLGLYITDAIARGHGGSVEVRSEEAAGTTFTLRLPR